MWVNTILDLAEPPPPLIEAWMTKATIVSEALKQHCKVLTVSVLSEQWEGSLWVRQVFLEGDGVPWTYGRVEVPKLTYQRHKQLFDSLGSQPIGEAILYGNPDVRRGPFEFTKVSATGWGRRSTFYIKEDPLVVIEYFLATLPPYA